MNAKTLREMLKEYHITAEFEGWGGDSELILSQRFVSEVEAEQEIKCKEFAYKEVIRDRQRIEEEKAELAKAFHAEVEGGRKLSEEIKEMVAFIENLKKLRKTDAQEIQKANEINKSLNEEIRRCEDTNATLIVGRKADAEEIQKLKESWEKLHSDFIFQSEAWQKTIDKNKVALQILKGTSLPKELHQKLSDLTKILDGEYPWYMKRMLNDVGKWLDDFEPFLVEVLSEERKSLRVALEGETK